eukprot:TRINITY_DN3830_c0_g1_i1.p1 TRINITY_DN3830_c0_g1~~TRINITY_DN3830_c0_g1_i1.p1  ORF type:complete len:383 (+),score=52.31 TRINITY_DN3830_c0_g1_i1:42-1190(+)
MSLNQMLKFADFTQEGFVAEERAATTHTLNKFPFLLQIQKFFLTQRDEMKNLRVPTLLAQRNVQTSKMGFATSVRLANSSIYPSQVIRIQAPESLPDWYLDQEIKRIEGKKAACFAQHKTANQLASNKYFLMKSCYAENIIVSQKKGIWATTPKNTAKLAQAFIYQDNVFLFFSVNKSGSFQGYARMESMPHERHSSGHFGAMENCFLGPCFRLNWLNTHTLPFEKAEEIVNLLNDNMPVTSNFARDICIVSRDGQELSSVAGKSLCAALDKEQAEAEIVKLKAHTNEKDSQGSEIPAERNVFDKEISAETASVSTELSNGEMKLTAEEKKQKRHKRLFKKVDTSQDTEKDMTFKRKKEEEVGKNTDLISSSILLTLSLIHI